MPASWVRVAQRRFTGPRGWAESDFQEDGDAAEIDRLTRPRAAAAKRAARNPDHMYSSGIVVFVADERILTVWRASGSLWSFPCLTAILPPECLAPPSLFYTSYTSCSPITATGLGVQPRLRRGPNTYSVLSSVNMLVVNLLPSSTRDTHIVAAELDALNYTLHSGTKHMRLNTNLLGAVLAPDEISSFPLSGMTAIIGSGPILHLLRHVPWIAKSNMTVLIAGETGSASGGTVSGMETMTMSIGEAFDPQDGAGAEQLLAKAGRSVYRARQHARIPRPAVAGLESPAYITLQ